MAHNKPMPVQRDMAREIRDRISRGQSVAEAVKAVTPVGERRLPTGDMKRGK